MKKSMILKATILFAEIVLLLLIVLSLVLMYGIKFDNLSYKNFAVSKLYIKYDKELIVSFDKIEIENNQLDANLSLDYNNGKLEVGIKHLYYYDGDLSLQGTFLLSYDEYVQYKEGNKTDIRLNNISFIYDKKLAPIKADEFVLLYKDEKLYFDFKKPTMYDIDIDGSSAVLSKLSDDITLELDLYTNHLLNGNLKKVIDYYDVTIPVTQTSGTNKIYTKLILPLNHIIDTKVFVKANIKKSNAILDDKKFFINNADVIYENDELEIKSNKGTMEFRGYLFDYSHLVLYLKNNLLSINSEIYDKSNNIYQLNTITDLESNFTQGGFYIEKFIYDKHLHVVDKNILFELDIKDDNNIYFKSSGNKIQYTKKDKESKLKINKFNEIIPYISFLDLYDNKHESTLQVISKDDLNTFEIKVDNLHARLDESLFKTNSKQNNTFNSFNLELYNGLVEYKQMKTKYDYIKLKINNNKLEYKTRMIHKNKNNFIINGIYELESKNIDGEVIIIDYQLENVTNINLVSFDFNGKIDENISLRSEYLDLNYTKSNDTHSLSITNLDSIIKYIPIIYKNTDANSSLLVFTNDNFKTSDVIVHNVQLHLDDTMLKQKKENSDESFRLLVKAFDSKVIYDQFTIDASVLELGMNKNKLDIQVIPMDKKGNLFFNKYKNEIKIKGDNLSSKFINILIDKKKFKDGTFSLKLQGDINKIAGKIKVNEVSIRDVAVVNNLITFINTTPALYNPLLALPTLYRLGQQNFDGSNYFVRTGHVNLVSDIKNKNVMVSDFYSKGTMMDFRGKGTIDFIKKKQDYKIDVIFLKDYARVIDNIPILNYLVLGDDGNFATQMDITGDFVSQDFETHTVKNASQGILNVLKRTITLPQKLFEMGTDSNQTQDGLEILEQMDKEEP